MTSVQAQAKELLDTYTRFQPERIREGVKPAHVNAQAKRVKQVLDKLGQPGAVVLGDPVGTGKTAVALTVAKILYERGEIDHILISVPNTAVRDLWRKRAEALFDEVLVAQPTKPRLQPGIPLVVSRGATNIKVQRPSDPSRMLVIADESHRGLQNEATAAYQALRHVAAGTRLLLVTATPYQLSVSGLETMLGIAKSASSGDRAELASVREYDKALQQLIHLSRKPSPDPDRLKGAVSEARQRRVAATKTLDRHLPAKYDRNAAGVPLPPRLHLDLIPCSDSAWLVAYQVASVVPELIDSGKGDMFRRRLVSSSESFRTGTAHQELASVAERAGAGGFVEELERRLGTGAAHPKVAATADWVTEKVKQGRHVVVFCVFHATRDVLADVIGQRLPGGANVEAPTTNSSLESLAARFQDPDAKPLVLILTDRFSESIDLDGGKPCLVHHDLVWNPVRFEQRWGRLVRISSRFTPIAKDDIFVPVLDVAVDRRLFETAADRTRLSATLLPLTEGDHEEDPSGVWTLTDQLLESLTE